MIRGPIERAYAALTDPALFPTWGPVGIEGVLAPGERPVLDFGPSGGGKVRILVVAAEVPRYFAYRWMQGVFDPEVLLRDPLTGPNTLVEFHLETVAEGTRVRVVESGIAALPAVPGMDADTSLANMGKGWELMIGGLALAIDGAGPPKDRLENEMVLRVERGRVFDDLLHPERWWHATTEGTFAAGESPILDFGPFGRFRFFVVAVDAPGYLAYRVNLGAEDPAERLADPRTAPSTLVEFRLADRGGATEVHHAESGLDAIPGDRVANYRKAIQRWGIVLGMFQMHVTKS